MKKENEDVDIRPFAYAMSLIEGKWKMHIVHSSHDYHMHN